MQLLRESSTHLTLVLACDSILGHVGIDHRSRLQKELPQQWLTDLLIQPPHIHRRIWSGGKTKSRVRPVNRGSWKPQLEAPAVRGHEGLVLKSLKFKAEIPP